MTFDSDWFPSAELEQIIVVQNIEDKIVKYQAELGLSSGDMTKIHLILQTFLAVVPKSIEIQATAKSFTTFKNRIKDGLEGDSAPAAPVFSVVALPVGATCGVVNQLRKLRNGWLFKDGYTPEIGADLMIIGTQETEKPDADLEAALKYSVAGEYTTTFTFSRQGMDAMRIEWRLAETETWHLGSDFTSSPANVAVAPTTPNQPVTVEFRARLMKRNSPIGKWSPIYTVFVTP